MRFWLSQHLFVGLSMFLMPDPPAVDHGEPRAKLAEYATLYALRGIGLTPEAITRCFNPSHLNQSLEHLMKNLQHSSSEGARPGRSSL